jgi:hypothetical protein
MCLGVFSTQDYDARGRHVTPYSETLVRNLLVGVVSAAHTNVMRPQMRPMRLPSCGEIQA